MCRRFDPGPHHSKIASTVVEAIFVCMYTVYVLLSAASGKHYVGFTNNIDRRMQEHNYTEKKGFTLRYRPWTLIHTEAFATKAEAMAREKFFKSGQGRTALKAILDML